MVLRARKLSGAFVKRVPGLDRGPLDPETSALIMSLDTASHTRRQGCRLKTGSLAQAFGTSVQ